MFSNQLKHWMGTHLAKSSPWRASGCGYPSCRHAASRILLHASTSSSGVMHGKGRGQDDRAHHATCGRRSPLPALHPGRSRMLMGRLRAPPLAAFAPCCSTTPQPPRPLAASVPCCSTPPQPLRPWGHRAFAAQGRAHSLLLGATALLPLASPRRFGSRWGGSEGRRDEMRG